MRDQFIQANIDEIGRLTDGRVGNSASIPSNTMAFVPTGPNCLGEKKPHASALSPTIAPINQIPIEFDGLQEATKFIALAQSRPRPLKC